MKCNLAKLSERILLTSLVVNLSLAWVSSVKAQDFSDPADIIMMNAQRRGLVPEGNSVPLVRPSTSHTSESTSFTDKSHGPFDIAPSNEQGASPFSQPANGASAISPSQTVGSRTSSGMTAQQLFDRGCDKTAVANFAEAIKDYDEAIKVDPNFGKAYANRGSARYNTGDHKGALADFEVAARLMPENQAVSALRDQIRNSFR